MEAARSAARSRPLDEDAELALYSTAMDMLEAAGFEHYEISSFARPGRRCRHNQVYWANEAYFGFGMGAARYVHGRRELNTRDLKTYIRQVLSGEPATFQSEELGPEERARETMAVQLRRAEGIDRPAFRVQTGFDLETVASRRWRRWSSRGCWPTTAPRAADAAREVCRGCGDRAAALRGPRGYNRLVPRSLNGGLDMPSPFPGMTLTSKLPTSGRIFTTA